MAEFIKNRFHLLLNFSLVFPLLLLGALYGEDALIFSHLGNFTFMLTIPLLTLYSLSFTLFLSQKNPELRKKKVFWYILSLAFFGQLILGIFFSSQFLKTGKMFIPYPALQIIRPFLYNIGYIYLFIFTISVIITGPVWCSHICPLGIWDYQLGNNKKKGNSVQSIFLVGRIMIFLTFIILLQLYLLDVLSLKASVIISFALAWLLVVTGGILSRKTGYAVHCSSFCPVGFIATQASRFSLFRIKKRKGAKTTDKLRLCRYGALDNNNKNTTKPGLQCTCCLDCVDEDQQYRVTFLKHQGIFVFRVFCALIAAFHTFFLAFVRI
ncbi:MAG: 4Fe-4S binding protein [Deltaproteobacteria bacterium]|jgi:polyferredoxin|nr:4Fe-4S binding protein [Deltaproteobacteria bacterium]